MAKRRLVESEYNPDQMPDRETNIFTFTVQSLLITIGVAAIIATLFTAWSPTDILGSASGSQPRNYDPGFSLEDWPTATPRPVPNIGIVVGHWGDYEDYGSICADGLTEFELNQVIATLVQKNLIDAGFDAELLMEFDDRLNNYTAAALVSIHADTCDYIDANATGFKVALTSASTRKDKAERLTACIAQEYKKVTGLKNHIGSVTKDMRQYHAFAEINPSTAAVIIETGFMNLDRDLLENEPEKVALGISEGILCFIRNDPVTY